MILSGERMSEIAGAQIQAALVPPPPSQQAQHALDWIGDASGSDEPTPAQEESTKGQNTACPR